MQQFYKIRSDTCLLSWCGWHLTSCFLVLLIKPYPLKLVFDIFGYFQNILHLFGKITKRFFCFYSFIVFVIITNNDKITILLRKLVALVFQRPTYRGILVWVSFITWPYTHFRCKKGATQESCNILIWC